MKSEAALPACRLAAASAALRCCACLAHDVRLVPLPCPASLPPCPQSMR